MSTYSSEPVVLSDQESDQVSYQRLDQRLDRPSITQQNQPSAPITQLSNINLSFGQGNSRVEVLRDINLELQTGDFICVLGSSGCGKTTLLRVLAGYQKPTTGIVTVAGKLHTQPDPDVGVVFQRPNLFPWLTIAKNVEFGLKMRGVNKLKRKQQGSHYLQLVGLENSARRLPHQLSGGMQQRAAIARALAADPQIILMDEPFGALDAITRNSMQDHLRGIWEQTRKTVFFITHDVEEALLLATRIVVMHAHPGRIVQDIPNPFIHTLSRLPAAQLRLSPEFVKMREQLVTSIHQDRESDT